MDWYDPMVWADISARVVAVASILNMVVPTTTKLGKAINAFALGWGKAAPDPSKQ